MVEGLSPRRERGEEGLLARGNWLEEGRWLIEEYDGMDGRIE